MKLVELEIERHDWAALQCGCGQSAAHVASDLLRLAKANTSGECTTDIIDNGHVFLPDVLFAPSVPTVSVALAALADDVPLHAREQYTGLLLCLVGDNGQSFEAVRAGRDLVAECIQAAKSGIWLLYAEIFAGRSVTVASYAYETLTLIEDDTDRLARVQAAAGELLAWNLR
ncbi:hypothetical protein [Microtetraspora malaysiensis]|uniref:hypothetical protein n=1 Tax=Microtetraspora malaysiensis TaxID=161358 RepID=UPI0008373596|nr:hypothetical protein [Microtetraspora malaysiensis]